ncbi:MAG TPA: hypothetical protein VJS67_11795 [Pseudonocardiaceae bacterium]|nr:hypothetical protein [Pseudonocardiaceae bacterium]
MIISKRSTHEQLLAAALLNHTCNPSGMIIIRRAQAAPTGSAHEAFAAGPDPLHLSLVFKLSG